MRMNRSRTLVVWVLAGVALMATACTDSPAGPPVSAVTPPPPEHAPLRNFQIVDDGGVEYEMDTGDAACPAILHSHVKYWVPINAVGPRLFTFFAPHTRIGYLGKGVYRYRMTLGRSDDNEWLAEGAWTGKCIGFGQWGIGKVLSFEGTVWQVGDDGWGDGCGDGGADGYSLDTYDPYSATPDCGGDGGGSEGGGDGGGGECSWEYIVIEISNDGGQTWEHYWSGWAEVCQ